MQKIDVLVDFLVKTTDWEGRSKEIGNLISNMTANQILEALDKASKIRERLADTPLGKELS
jgi:hypothetical protein